MTVHIILGVTIDTPNFINFLRFNKGVQIIVLDYDYIGPPIVINGIYYMSQNDAKNYVLNFSNVKFYKSLYAYPGMGGKMSSLNKKELEGDN